MADTGCRCWQTGIKERMTDFLLIFLSQVLWASPAEQYSRQENHYTNQMRETSTGATLPAQDFKRSGATAKFVDENLTYTISVYHVNPDDMVYFLVLSKDIAADSGGHHQGNVRAFRMAEDGKTVEEIRMKSASTVQTMTDGSIKIVYESDRYAEGAYTMATTRPWRTGMRIDTDFFNFNENVGVDTTITNAHQTTYSLPITLDTFRNYLPATLWLFFDTFRLVNHTTVQWSEDFVRCSQDCETLKEKRTQSMVRRDLIWDSVTMSDVAAIKPQKLKSAGNGPPQRRVEIRKKPRAVVRHEAEDQSKPEKSVGGRLFDLFGMGLR
jgi:hypothetical protein